MNNFQQSKIQPYKFSGKIVNRTSLIEKLNKNKEKSLLLICAPAGYGKRSLALEFLNFNSVKFSWLNIHPEMSNFYVFINYLVLSLKKVDKSFGKSTQLMIDDYREKFNFDSHQEIIINDIIAVFQNDLLQSFEDEVYIVLDDLGKISDAFWIKSTFEKMFENLPANIHFVITSRSIPDINTGLLKAKRNMLKIGMQELAFTAEETGILVNDLYGMNISGNEIMSLSSNLNGWITGIHLILQSYGSSFPGIKFDKIKVLDDVFNYFTEDIFSTLNSETQDFLLFTSLLDTFTPGLCNKLLNITRSS